jgi:hypothetical protein
VTKEFPINKLPKIKIKLPPGYPEEEAFDLEEAGDRLNFERGVIAVDGQRVPSYDELVKIASQDKYKNIEYIEVVVALFATGG